MKYKNKSLQISCDGGAATGKSTGARMIAKKFNLKFLSSGLLYRYASFLILKHKPRNVIIFLEKKFKNLNYKKLDKINLHTSQVSKKSALIAKVRKIREILKKYQGSHVIYIGDWPAKGVGMSAPECCSQKFLDILQDEWRVIEHVVLPHWPQSPNDLFILERQ